MKKPTAQLLLAQAQELLQHSIVPKDKAALRHVNQALQALAAEVDPNDPTLKLSERELQVVELLARGERALDIAREVGLSIKTISTYRTRALAKLGLQTTGELIAYGVRHGFAG